MTNLINIDLNNLNTTDLKALAKEFKVKNWWNLKKAELRLELGVIQSTLEEETKAEEPKKKAPKDKKEKVDKDEDNLITLKELAAEFGMKGTKARRILRDHTVSRPYGGNRWEWDTDLHQDELEMARTALKKYIKSQSN